MFLYVLVLVMLAFEWVCSNNVAGGVEELLQDFPRLRAPLVAVYQIIVTNLLYVRLALIVLLVIEELTKENPLDKLAPQKEAVNSLEIILEAAVLLVLVALFLYPPDRYIISRYVYPMTPFFIILLLPQLMGDIGTHLLREKGFVLKTGMKGKDTEDSLVWKTVGKKCILTANPWQGIYIEGAAGSGKSASVIGPIIEQAAKKNFAGFLYDYKGAPPTLSRQLYNALQKYPSKVKFAHINFSLPFLSGRCNPLAPRYISSKLHAQEYATTILKNLNKDWITRQDFWCLNAIAYLSGILWFLKNYYPCYCTLPHATLLGLQEVGAVMKLISRDREVHSMVSPIAHAYQQGAKDQLAGIVASFQLPLGKIYNKNIFWVMNGQGGEDHIDLDLTSPTHPTFLTVANDPGLSEGLCPVISLIATVCMKNMNQQGKHKALFLLDEAPTLFIPDLSTLPATARSNKVSTILCVQDYAQLKKYYGAHDAQVMRANLGNQFFGMTNNLETAKYVSELVGEYEKVTRSLSKSKGHTTESTSLKKEAILSPTAIMNQAAGHFVVRISSADPPIVAAQLAGLSPAALPLNKQPREGLTLLIEENYKQIHQEVHSLFASSQAPSYPASFNKSYEKDIVSYQEGT